MMKSTKGQITAMIREAVTNALSATEYDERGLSIVPLEDRKARAAGKKEAAVKFANKTPEELKTAYLAIERKAEELYQDTVKHTYLWGVLDKIKELLKKGYQQELPRKDQNPWNR